MFRPYTSTTKMLYYEFGFKFDFCSNVVLMVLNVYSYLRHVSVIVGL